MRLTPGSAAAAVGGKRKSDVRISRPPVKSNRASTVKDRRDLDNVVAEAIDDSVVTVDDLADGLVAKLRYDAP